MKRNREKLNNEENIKFKLIGELIFNFLTIIILISIKLLNKSYENFIYRSDWSYISMVLYGQTMVKLFSGVSTNRNSKEVEKFVLILILLISLGLVPSIVFLVLMEIGRKTIVLVILQIVWLIFGGITYWVLGGFGIVLEKLEIITEDNFIKEPTQQNEQ